MSEPYCTICGKNHEERAVNECRHNLSVAIGQETRIALDYQQQRDEWRHRCTVLTADLKRLRAAAIRMYAAETVQRKFGDHSAAVKHLGVVLSDLTPERGEEPAQ